MRTGAGAAGLVLESSDDRIARLWQLDALARFEGLDDVHGIDAIRLGATWEIRLPFSSWMLQLPRALFDLCQCTLEHGALFGVERIEQECLAFEHNRLDFAVERAAGRGEPHHQVAPVVRIGGAGDEAILFEPCDCAADLHLGQGGARAKFGGIELAFLRQLRDHPPLVARELEAVGINGGQRAAAGGNPSFSRNGQHFLDVDHLFVTPSARRVERKKPLVAVEAQDRKSRRMQLPGRGPACCTW